MSIHRALRIFFYSIILHISSLNCIVYAESIPKTKLIVGTKIAAPFAIKNDDGSWSGISIDLWRSIAGELHLDYEFHETDLKGLISGVQDSSLDLAIAAISITAEREKQLDFSHPYYNSGLGIAVVPQGHAAWLEVLSHFASLDFLKLIGILLISIMVMGTLMWGLERRRNPEQFGGPWRKGVGSGFWWSAVTLTTVGYGDKTPATLL
ncbi:MAG: transporter substrate-binding domain-containing protein, partial [Bacteroidota bacterium]